MSTTPTPTPAPVPTAATTKTKTEPQSIGLYVELAGAVSFIAGTILSMSMHHYAIGICFVAGVAAILAGKKLRAA